MRWFLVLMLGSLALAQNTTGSSATGTFTIGSLGCGLPGYVCGSTSVVDAGNITALFTSSLVAGNAASCSGDCKNTCKEDLTIPGHLPGTYKICRMTDGTNITSGKSVGNFSSNGGDNERMISKKLGDGTRYIAVQTNGDAVRIYHITTVAGYPQVLNAGIPGILGTGHNLDSFGFTWNIPTRFYYSTNTGELHQGDITSDNTYKDTPLVTLITPGVCPGWTPFSISTVGILGISDDDDQISGMFQPTSGGGQGSADWIFAWSKTRGCYTANLKTGRAYDFCKAPSVCNNTTPPIVATMGTTAYDCWGSDGSVGHGIHNVQISGNGLFMNISHASPWTQGGCAGLSGGTPGETVLKLSTVEAKWCSNSVSPVPPGNLICGSHKSIGVANMMTPGTATTPVTGPTMKPLADLTQVTTYYPALGINDFHCSWAHDNYGVFDDTLPWVCAGDSAQNSNSTIGINGCTNANLCPKAFQNEIWAVSPGFPGIARRIAHTYTCGGTGFALCPSGIADPFGAANAIGIVSPEGDLFCWVTSMLQNTGNDNTGKPRQDIYCISLGVGIGSSINH